MARKSILTSVLAERPVVQDLAPVPMQESAPRRVAATTKPSRIAKLHVGGYYYPDNTTIIAFQKLGIDLRRTQQDMLMEAIADFVAKHEASRAFNS
jgi:hypothetical protein